MGTAGFAKLGFEFVDHVSNGVIFFVELGDADFGFAGGAKNVGEGAGSFFGWHLEWLKM